jgi:AbrB family looped-hinge helix DNA binding protein
MPSTKKDLNIYGTCHGTTSLGERGQVVIPKKVRSKLSLKKGDNFLVIEKDGVIILAPTSVVESMISNLSNLSEELKNSHIK